MCDYYFVSIWGPSGHIREQRRDQPQQGLGDVHEGTRFVTQSLKGLTFFIQNLTVQFCTAVVLINTAQSPQFSLKIRNL